MDNLVLVRYSSGSGGEALCWWLNELLNCSAETMSINEDNRVHFNDVFDGKFNLIPICDQLRARFDISAIRWDGATVEQVRRVVEWYLENADPAPAFKIGKSHYPLRDEQWKIFAPAHVIDVAPSADFVWTIQTLLTYKVALTRARIDLWPSAMMGHPQYEEARAMTERNGWMPGYFAWTLQFRDRDIHDVSGFLDRMFVSDICIEENSFPESDFMIRADTLAFDESLSWLKTLAAHFGKEYPLHLEPVMRNWVANNRKVMANLGFLDRIGKPLDAGEMKELKRAFLDHAARILSD